MFIEISNLTKSFKLFTRTAGLKGAIKSFFNREYKYFTALNNINLSVREGEIIGILGENGAGKTTLIKLMVGLLYPSTGNVIVNGAALITSTTITTPDQYLRKQFVKKAASISIPSTASFTALTASAPVGMTATNEQDFVFFINGQYMEHDALTIKQTGSSLLLLVDTDSIGYSLEADDEIIALNRRLDWVLAEKFYPGIPGRRRS